MDLGTLRRFEAGARLLLSGALTCACDAAATQEGGGEVGVGAAASVVVWRAAVRTVVTGLQMCVHCKPGVEADGAGGIC